MCVGIDRFRTGVKLHIHCESLLVAYAIIARGGGLYTECDTLRGYVVMFRNEN